MTRSRLIGARGRRIAFTPRRGGAVCTPMVYAPSICTEWVPFTFVEPTPPQPGEGGWTHGTATTDTQLKNALATPGLHVTVPAGTSIGAFSHNVDVDWRDVIVTIEAGAEVAGILMDRFSGTAVQQRIAFQGPGKLGGLSMANNRSSDIILDGLAFDGSLIDGTFDQALNCVNGITRLGIYNCVIRAPITAGNGGCLLHGTGSDVIVYNSNLRGAPGATANDWCVRSGGPFSRRILYGCQMQSATRHAVRQGSGVGIVDLWSRANRIVNLQLLECAYDIDDPIGTDRIVGEYNEYAMDDASTPGMGLLFGGNDSTGGGGYGSLSVTETNATYRTRAAYDIAAALAAKEAQGALAGLSWSYRSGATYAGYADHAALAAAVATWQSITGPNIVLDVLGPPSPQVIGSDPWLL